MTFSEYLKTTIKLNKGLSGLSIFNHRRIYNEWESQIISNITPLDSELPWITIIAKNFLIENLKKKIKSDVRVFEFGSGGSSIFFLNYAHQVVSVEHDKEWFELVSRSIKQKKIPGWEGHLIEPEHMIENLTIKLDASDPNHYYTTDEFFLNYQFKNYASYIDRFPENYFDIVLVDGRSRPSCIYHSLNKVKQGGLLVIDNAERDYYLSKNTINKSHYKLAVSSYSTVVCSNAFSQTNIYQKL